MVYKANTLKQATIYTIKHFNSLHLCITITFNRNSYKPQATIQKSTLVRKQSFFHFIIITLQGIMITFFILKAVFIFKKDSAPCTLINQNCICFHNSLPTCIIVSEYPFSC